MVAFLEIFFAVAFVTPSPFHAVVDRGISVSVDRPIPMDVWGIGAVLASAVVAILTGCLALSTRGLGGKTAALAARTGEVADATKILAQQTAEVATKTGLLASETAALARETTAANRLADCHHQEALAPVLVVEGTRIASSATNLAATGFMKNIGAGVALNVRAWIGEIGEPTRLSPVGAGEKKAFTSSVLLANSMAPQMPIKLVLLYENFFGAEARSEFYMKIGIEDNFDSISILSPPLVARVLDTSDVLQSPEG